MTELFLLLLPIQFPLDLVARMREVTRNYLSEIISWFEDPLVLAGAHQDPALRSGLEAHIAIAERGVHLPIHERARQIFGLRHVFTPRLIGPGCRRDRRQGRSTSVSSISPACSTFSIAWRTAARNACGVRKSPTPSGSAPSCPLPTQHSEISVTFPTRRCAPQETGVRARPMTTRVRILRLKWQAKKRLAPARRD